MVPSLRPLSGLCVVLCFVGGAWAVLLSAAAGGFERREDIRIPAMFDCDHLPEWRHFRSAATEAVAGGFVRSDALHREASTLEERWRSWVCKDSDSGGGCRTTADFSHEFVRELQLQCRDSNNFDRYLVRHYFTNTNTEFTPLEQPSGFCLFGYVTALIVLAWHSLPDHVGQALRHTFVAHHLLGHYHSFDFLESSSWPVTSFLVLVNILAGGQEFLPMLEPPDYRHPGEFGIGWYLDRLAWASTTEASKPKPGAAPFISLPFDVAPSAWRGRGRGRPRPTISVWQFCIHTSTAGEAVTMIKRFLSHDFDVQFRGNSLAAQLCGNYAPSLCAEGSTGEFLNWLSDRFLAQDMHYAEVSTRFVQRLLPELQQFDVWMCSIPAVWCRLLADANDALPESVARRPIFAYLGLPIFQYVGHDDRMDFLHAFEKLVLDERSVVVANNPYLSEEVAWQTGLRIPTIRIHGLHTNTTWLPIRDAEVLVSRPGTSGGWQECVLSRFLDANPTYPLRFVQFTNLLNPHTTKEVYNTSLSYSELAQYRAVVGFPYDTSLMFFWEFYSMNMPLYVPFDLWRWGIYGQHTRPDLEQPVLDRSDVQRNPFSPFFDGFKPLDVESSLFWSKFTDWAMFPHVQYFRSIADLMVQLVQADLQAVSSSMKSFNEASLVQSAAVWRYVVERWLSVETLS